MSSSLTMPAKVRATGPSRTPILPLKVFLLTTSVNSAPGIQGAMRSTSSRSFQAWAGGSGTSNELSNSMMLSLVPIANHVSGDEFPPDPAGAGQPTSGATRRDELDPDRQAPRAE